MAERHSPYAREADDYYVEPRWVADYLFDRVPLKALHDPCCGGGTIVDAALDRGIAASGSDLRDRAAGRFPVRDFLGCQRVEAAVVTNPPFKIAPAIVEHALTVVRPGGIVAIVAQAKFLFSQGRHPLFDRPTMEQVIIFSRRPSMPTGQFLEEHGEAGRGGGSIDFVWAVWRVGKAQPGARIVWAI